MAGHAELPADDAGHPRQGPQRRGEAGGFGACGEDLGQTLVLLGAQPRLASGAASGLEGRGTALLASLMPAQHRLPADAHAPGHFGLGQAFVQEFGGPQAPLFQSFEITLSCHAKHYGTGRRACHYITQ